MSKKKNESPQNIQKRNMAIIGGIGVGVFVVAGALMLRGGGENVEDAGDAKAIGVVAGEQNIPGVEASEEYNKSVKDFNDRQAKIALDNGETFVGTIVNESTTGQINALDLLDRSMDEQKKKEEQEDIEVKQREINMDNIEITPEIVQAEVNVAQESTELPEIDNGYVANANPPKYGQQDFVILGALLDLQQARPSTSEFNYYGDTSLLSASAKKNASFENDAANGQTFTEKKQVLVKAGDILSAVLLTGVNSKEPSPVIAQVVSGRFKGARLIGGISVVGKKVVLTFTTISLPGESSSKPIQAVAIDLDTSRTALASDVDNHYFLRYGLLAAASLVKGWATAVSNNNQVTRVSDSGTITINTGDKSSKQINREALGELGGDIASEIRNSRNELKPTIYVDKDIAIGILFLQDF